MYETELKYTPKGVAVCTFVLASNRYWKQDDEVKEEVSFFEVTAWNRQAEVCGEYLKKGRGVRVVGRLKQDRWADPEGKNRWKVSIVAEHVEFKPPKKDTPEGRDGDREEVETGAAKEGELAEVT